MSARGVTELYILAGLAVAAGAGGAIWYVYHEGHDAGYAEAYNEIREVELMQAAQENKAAARLEVDRERTRVVYRTITKEVDRVVDRPVYRDSCFDDSGLRLANSALAAALEPAGEPDRRMPDADAIGGRQGVHGAAKDGGSR